ncbi:hypothetical protein R1sor_015989 [Riccia sorocarpa]|uniref:Endoplasmic reticulum transmembrane protein n=1 Tax=Riccia sorocarpa TaxID=122646 RepID=A0ABD3HH69_9MARC
MALEWLGLALVAGAEAILLTLLTLPGMEGLRKGLIQVSQGLLQPLLAAVPLALFLGVDIFWKLQNLPEVHGHAGELEKQAKSLLKSQRNALLVITTLFLYWLLFRVTRMQIRLEHLQQQVARAKRCGILVAVLGRGFAQEI